MNPLVAKKFGQLGLVTLRDALFYFPFRHEDWRHRTTIDQLTSGQEVTIQARVVKISSRRAWHRRGTIITDVTVTDDSGAKLHVVWFNLPFLIKTLKAGDKLFLSGEIVSKNNRLQLNNPIYEKPSADPLHQRLIPVYRTTEGLSQRQIRLVVKQAVSLAAVIPDPLTTTVALANGWLNLPTALQQIHFPESPELAHQAVWRLKFDELLAWHLRMVMASQATTHQPAPKITFHEVEIRSFVQRLPFELTADQRIAAWQTLQDMDKTVPMARLIQGEVGSGKTVIAALIAYNAALSNTQVALVAPTVVLAEQHWQTFIKLLRDRHIGLALLTGNQAKALIEDVEQELSRTQLLSAIAAGEISILIGTHAIIQPNVLFKRLGLVIVDEQQRFGVDQRQLLLEGRTETPHFLSLTATPIPRSFALWLTGILAISSIKTKPAGRPPITSQVIGPTQRDQVDRAIRDTVNHKQQVYVITPLIEESDSLGVRAATTEHQRLVEAMPHMRIGILHGAMPADERINVLEKFRRQEFDVIVSTTVIEVGVDVANATLMVIEGAERFGLSQLHQLRGRIGRGELPSRCLFVTDRTEATTMERLTRVASLNDGFAIAELDLTERGAGDLYGQRQSGLPAWQLASLNDREIFTAVQQFVSGLSDIEQTKLHRALTEDEPDLGGWHRE